MVSLPLALPAHGMTTVYLPAAGQWTATVLDAAGGIVWRGGAMSAAAGDALTLRSVRDDAEDAAARIIRGGTA